MWNSIISVRSEIEVRGDIRLAGLSRDLDEANVNKAVLKAVIEKAQGKLVTQLCGGKYARDRDAKFKRAGTTGRTPETRHGTIRFKLAKVKRLENGSILRPFLLYIGLEPWKRIIDDPRL